MLRAQGNAGAGRRLWPGLGGPEAGRCRGWARPAHPGAPAAQRHGARPGAHRPRAAHGPAAALSPRLQDGHRDSGGPGGARHRRDDPCSGRGRRGRRAWRRYAARSPRPARMPTLPRNRARSTSPAASGHQPDPLGFRVDDEHRQSWLRRRQDRSRRGSSPSLPPRVGQIAWLLNLHHPYDPLSPVDSLAVAARAINNIIGGATLTGANGKPAVQPGLRACRRTAPGTPGRLPSSRAPGSPACAPAR